MIRKPYENLLALDAHWHRGPREPQKGPWAQILTEIWYMSLNTRLIFTLIICSGHLMTFNTRSPFTSVLTYYVDSFVNSVMQRSMLDDQESCKMFWTDIPKMACQGEIWGVFCWVQIFLCFLYLLLYHMPYQYKRTPVHIMQCNAACEAMPNLHIRSIICLFVWYQLLNNSKDITRSLWHLLMAYYNQRHNINCYLSISLFSLSTPCFASLF